MGDGALLLCMESSAFAGRSLLGPTTRIRIHSIGCCSQSIGGPMIGVLVTFTKPDKFDRATVAKIADEERGKFEGMPGLRFKSFTLDDAGQARSFYLWDD